MIDGSDGLDGHRANADAAVRELLERSTGAAADRPLPELLTEVVDAARRIVRCDYAAVTVLGTPGRPEFVVPVEVDGARLADRLPESGAVQLVARDGVALRVPGPDGVLDGRPPAVVGVPVRVRGKGAGGLFLADPVGRPAFDDADARIAELVAAAAGHVIERSRTAVANRHREQWYAGGAALAKEIVEGRCADPLQLIAGRVAEIADADSVSILQHGAAEDTLLVAAAVGAVPDGWRGRALVVPNSLSGRVMATGKPAGLSHLATSSNAPELADLREADSVIVVPLLGSGAQHGVLVIGRNADAPAITAAETGMATMFAGTVALALELAESQVRRDQRALIEERDRIARDLHDHVIQRLYAIGLTMQGVAGTAAGTTEQRLTSSIDEIDETIKQIRSTIFRLTMPILSSERSLRARAEKLLDELEPALGFRPRLVSHGPIDFGVDEDVIDDCVAVLREAVTNIARHARAAEAEVAIDVSATALRLEIRDDGHGLGAATRRSGLANLRARAEQRGGFLQVRSSATDGTWLLWSVPLDGAPIGPPGS